MEMVKRFSMRYTGEPSDYRFTRLGFGLAQYMMANAEVWVEEIEGTRSVKLGTGPEGRIIRFEWDLGVGGRDNVHYFELADRSPEEEKRLVREVAAIYEQHRFSVEGNDPRIEQGSN